MHPKDADSMANSVDPDQTAIQALLRNRVLIWNSPLSDLRLHCLPFLHTFFYSVFFFTTPLPEYKSSVNR